MDLCSIHVKNTRYSHRAAILLRNSIQEKPISKWDSSSRSSLMMAQTHGGFLRVLEMRVSERRKPHRCHPFVVRAVGKKNSRNFNNNDSDDSSSSSSSEQEQKEGDSQKGSNASESNKSKDSGSQKPKRKPLDWREFRASLYIQEQTETVAFDNHKEERESLMGPNSLPPKWAHPISAPENGCLLVATEKLDGVDSFERSVVLLLRSGTRHPQEGPFGIVINRPCHKRINDMKSTNPDLKKTFAESDVHFGGPLEASMFLLRAGENASLVHGFEEVMPGVCFGARNSLEDACALVKKGVLKPKDFRFFIGYAGWQFDQLRDEIDSEYWYVAACSSNLIFGGSESSSSSEGLWEEILQLMGGHYSELSRKPKQDI
ncbi:OLC1v1018452C1 [Oldenlandia corymbosa var. corymbosa]|uniref:OLC1v1018452C1 n=1 Tax=Oldenlandia corymbosa var. corymbosa TaxID=529605 RepID=A0AAV1EBT8_OLDCO|nr:OLC1v1018452C1 [Oldenlandia corymbosa var. corymbosa]